MRNSEHFHARAAFYRKLAASHGAAWNSQSLAAIASMFASMASDTSARELAREFEAAAVEAGVAIYHIPGRRDDTGTRRGALGTGIVGSAGLFQLLAPAVAIPERGVLGTMLMLLSAIALPGRFARRGRQTLYVMFQSLP